MKISQDWIQHPQWWFHSTPQTDREVMKHYGDFFQIHIQDDLDSVILYDQLARHYFRNEPVMLFMQTSKAVIIAKRLLIGNIGRFSPEEFVFILLPLRHTKQPKEIQNSIFHLKQHPAFRDPYPSIMVRFYKAGITQLSKFHTFFMDQYVAEYDIPNWNVFRDILEYCPERLCQRQSPDIFGIQTFLNKHQPKRIIVSLSGGVDSMVLLHTLLDKNVPIEAVHINYRNRGDICDLEVDMMRNYCSYLGVSFTVRRIEEILRTKDQFRDFYEDITREIRFEMYKMLAGTDGMVLLGHHQDDAVENILSNIRKGRNWDNLMGMTETHYEKGVWIGRPFLKFRKEEIIGYAKDNHIPYLEDSTPMWSERGQMRDDVIPALNRFPNQCQGFIEMAVEMKRMDSLIRKSLWEPYQKQMIRETENIYTLPFGLCYLEWGVAFWAPFLIDIAREWKVVYPSRKAIYNFMKAMTHGSLRVQLSKDIQIRVKQNRFIIEKISSKQ